MNGFNRILPDQITDNTFKLIGKDWMLVTAAHDGDGTEGGRDYNTMTASWGGFGVLWNKPVAFVFIRPQRHTFLFTESNERMTLSFFSEDYRPALSYCGKFSGADGDKAKACGLTPLSDSTDHGRAVWFAEARLVLKTRKLYEEDLKESAVLDDSVLKHYPSKDYHKMYICEIEEVLLR